MCQCQALRCRALKTKGNTPKYGLIFHSSFIGRAKQRNKGRISRYLANKCSMACRCTSTILAPPLQPQIQLSRKYSSLSCDALSHALCCCAALTCSASCSVLSPGDKDKLEGCAVGTDMNVEGSSVLHSRAAPTSSESCVGLCDGCPARAESTASRSSRGQTRLGRSCGSRLRSGCASTRRASPPARMQTPCRCASAHLQRIPRGLVDISGRPSRPDGNSGLRGSQGALTRNVCISFSCLCSGRHAQSPSFVHGTRACFSQ